MTQPIFYPTEPRPGAPRVPTTPPPVPYRLDLDEQPRTVPSPTNLPTETFTVTRRSFLGTD